MNFRFRSHQLHQLHLRSNTFCNTGPVVRAVQSGIQRDGVKVGEATARDEHVGVLSRRVDRSPRTSSGTSLVFRLRRAETGRYANQHAAHYDRSLAQALRVDSDTECLSCRRPPVFWLHWHHLPGVVVHRLSCCDDRLNTL